MTRNFNYIFNFICPSFISGRDLASVEAGPELAHILPVSIKNISLMPHIRRELNRQRRLPVRPVREVGRKLTLIVPFRDRWEHLEVFAKETLPYLERCGHDCEVLVIEQEFGKPFNKGLLHNIGVKEARPDSEYYCFHDVDFVPIKTDYSYCSHPLRLVSESVWERQKDEGVGTLGFMDHYFGGVVLVTREHFEAINGFSNEYWHYGHEDDDMFLRFLYAGITPLYDYAGIFRELYHKPAVYKDERGGFSDRWEERQRLLGMKRRNSLLYRRFRRKLAGCESGLSSVEYSVTKREEREGFQSITVSL